MSNHDTHPHYGNWVQRRHVIWLWIITVVLLALAVDGFIMSWHVALNVILLLGGFVFLFFAASMTWLRRVFSYTGGHLMANVYDYIISKLNWDGKGKLLDVGCGTGSFTIRLAKKYPEGKISGIDSWSHGWDFTKNQCESNAKMEGVKNTYFSSGNAEKLSFPDESFDAVVSNFVFSDVKKEKNKQKLIRESLRVLKKGGVFAFHDNMEDRPLYGDIEKLIKELKKEGISEVYYDANTEDLPFVPKYASKVMLYRNLGLLYGRK